MTVFHLTGSTVLTGREHLAFRNSDDNDEDVINVYGYTLLCIYLT